MEQRIISADKDYYELDQWLNENHCTCVLLVSDKSIQFLKAFNRHLDLLRDNGVRIITFDDFQPNPLYESVVKGVEVLKSNNCNAIIAVGGGSAIDVAKCIKLYSNMSGGGKDGDYLKQTIVPNNTPFLAMPTTAGTGSEATRFAVIYYNGEKQSVTSDSFIPETVLMDSKCLETLPLYQKKATMMDAFCHAIESFWSVNSTEESKEYSRKAIQLIMKNMRGYLDNSNSGNSGMLLAAHTAGKAINITQTTAGHAMCYKITSLFGCAHGHAAALCDRVLFPWMIQNSDLCIDPRGEEYLKGTLLQIAHAMGCGSPEEAAEQFNKIFDSLELSVPEASDDQYEILRNSVNPVRLKNHPVILNNETIDNLYHRILN